MVPSVPEKQSWILKLVLILILILFATVDLLIYDMSHVRQIPDLLGERDMILSTCGKNSSVSVHVRITS